VSDLVRTVPSGSVGLDLVLGGGVRMLHRIAGVSAESATILVRGGPGAGKSVLATDIALRMARAVGGDVLYVCIEILPREVIAQRMGFDGFDPTTAIDLADAEARKVNTTVPTLVVGMTAMEMGPPEEGGAPDLGQMILDLLRISHVRGCKPLVVVVDSLTDGYNLGASVPRPVVDGVCKLAVEQGWVLVLVEETVNDDASPWSFAVDTVISLEVTEAGRREARVTKHRFGSCQPGPHRLLVEREGVRVIPCFAAYRNAARDLALPAPAQDRSLRVPVIGQAPDWTSFDVPNGQGKIITVQLDANLNSATVFDVADAVGATSPGGTAHADTGASLALGESHELPFTAYKSGFLGGTLHQMIDGEEWLEAALSQITSITAPLTRVTIGPSSELRVYEHVDDIQKAISLFAAILGRRGMIVVLYGGADLPQVVRAGIINERWIVSPVMTPPGPRLSVQRYILGSRRIDFEMATS
jgi:KaiC/GvpD/RAD55 family RecA-like ATPase